MKKSTKKVLSLALALIMMLSLLPVSAFAEGERGIWEVGDVTPIDLPEPLPEDRLYLKEPRTFRFAFLALDEQSLSVDAAAQALCRDL